MGNFLNFLSNNYIYFLIAAGVLFFALLGLLVDLKKKRDGENTVTEENVPDVGPSVPEPPVQAPVEEPVQEDFNPAPPMPEEEVVVPEISSEVAAQGQVLDSTPVMSIDTPSEPVPEENPTVENTTEELK